MKIFSMIIGFIMILFLFEEKDLSKKNVLFLIIFCLVAAALILFPLYLEFIWKIQ